MKLTDLNPHWVGAGGEGVFDADHNPVPERHGVGIGLDCPLCGPDHPLFVCFKNPLDGGAPIGNGRTLWKREGDTFETLTLTPSILRIKINGEGCEWHGYITKGEIKTC
jgi:hypothetical protein